MESLVGQLEVSMSRLHLSLSLTSQFYQVAVPLESARKDIDKDSCLFLFPHNQAIFLLLIFL